MKNVKLFIWTGFSRDYSDGLAFAIASNETEAKKLIIKEHGFEVLNWGDLEIRDVNVKIARCVSGGA